MMNNSWPYTLHHGRDTCGANAPCQFNQPKFIPVNKKNYHAPQSVSSAFLTGDRANRDCHALLNREKFVQISVDKMN
jgi:hypothetical protein